MKTSSLLSLSLLSLMASAPVLADSEQGLCQPKAYEMALRYQQQSAEIKAIQIQAYTLATYRLKEILQETKKSPKDLAVVLDLDETVLDNSPLLVRDMENCVDYTTWDTWSDWEKKGHPTLIPGAKDFIDFADKSGLNVYYVSDRFGENKPYTIKTLEELDLPQAEESHVLLYGTPKEARRQSIADNHDIVMLLGDSLPDFAAEFKNKKDTKYNRELVEKEASHFGKDWIVLPNASYGAWKKAELNAWEEK
ncbi:5'-nucleotidase, lipoprotein e(P4) family [Vibrio sp.]|uniref:5'-nucleotidase, lipoprotein e(P4) family n=1 Tax=Vibrio viridaestus TaxID=2487322 RepID=A0A3N9TEN1_9VIBR|nr:5'-nucleotidase, lipoprotein e(P4) family [Vibrio viridaestus]MDC0609167.1 5'-nucleotidase, lipoprotein e(P4) family [Vibrio sp.]RQW62324.1 5'-nucleotidase, lipoprotein e(P4) family [Vibrio viridaestus]